MLVGPTRAATSGSDDFALQRRFDGWPVVILPGKFPLGAGGGFYVKVRLTPGGAASGGAERLVIAAGFRVFLCGESGPNSVVTSQPDRIFSGKIAIRNYPDSRV